MAAAGSAALAWSGTVDAQPLAGVEVRWVAPVRCPGPDDVRARVRRLLGPRAPKASRQEPLIAEATVVAIDGRYRLTLTVRQGDESSGVTRIFESTSCESLAGAAAVTLALLARGEARSDGATPPGTSQPGTTEPAASPPAASPPATAQPATSAPAASPPATAQPSAPATSPPPTSPPAAPAPATAPADVVANAHPETPAFPSSTAPASPATSGPHVALAAPLLAVGTGVLPSWAYGVGAGVEARMDRLRVRLAGFLWLSRSASETLYEATYHRRSAELSGCYAWPEGSFEVGPCLAVTFEDVSASGSGPGVVSGSGHVRWLTVGVAARAGWSVRKWATLFVRPGVTFTTSRPTFAIDGVGPLYQVPLVAGGAEVGCEWIF
jgi:hypothetical protein